MDGYFEDKNGYKIFDTSTLNNFIQRSAQFEEEPIPYFELAPGECSSLQRHNDVIDDSNSNFFYNSDNDMDEYEIYVN